MQQDLVERAMAGDHEAFSELARASVDELYAVATLILRDTARAEDAVQDSLVSAWRDIRALRDSGAWRAWLRRLTVRSCYRLAARDRRRLVVEIAASPPGEPLEPFDPTTTLGDRDELERALETLPVDQRALLVLHFYLDLTLVAAAELLDIPIGTAKSRLHYGLAELRRSMGSTRPKTGTKALETVP